MQSYRQKLNLILYGYDRLPHGVFEYLENILETKSYCLQISVLVVLEN